MLHSKSSRINRSNSKSNTHTPCWFFASANVRQNVQVSSSQGCLFARCRLLVFTVTAMQTLCLNSPFSNWNAAAAVATVRAAVLASARLSRCHSEKYALGAFKNFISAQPGTSGAATLSKKHLSLFHILPRQAYAYSFHLRTQYAVFSIVCQRYRLLNWGT